MKIISFLFNIFVCTNAFIRTPNVKTRTQDVSHSVMFYTPQNQESSHQTQTQKKINGFLNLIRYNNILPTTLLCFTGAWIVNPSIYNLFHSKDFIVSTVDTLIVMSNSMIINDIYDIDIDRVNNKSKPLVTGEIKIGEAIVAFFFLLFVSEALSFYFLPENLQTVVILANIFINIYTPFLKKIPIVKNISCALLVSFSVFFTGLSASTGQILTDNANFTLFSIIINMIFLGSLSNEIVLDIRDMEGDRLNNIYTIPVIFGREFTIIIATNVIIYFNLIRTSVSLGYFYENVWVALFISILFLPIQSGSYEIDKNNYSEKSIKEFLKNANMSLFAILIYVCVLVGYLK